MSEDAPTSPPQWVLDLRRLSIEKPAVVDERPAVDRLPDEIIEQILLATDPNGFASLIAVNRKWRDVSQRTDLYLHHLARCPSFIVNPNGLPSSDPENLARVRRLFGREIKRNLFQAYLRPRETLVKLVSNSISSSSAPGGDGMQFSTSLRGNHVLAYNSSRIYIIDVTGPSVDVKRELKILRRPAAACITDCAGLLAVLSSEMQVDIYDLTQSPPRRKQSLILDNNPRTIALSSCGSVLAAAYEGGIEVSSVNPGALPTERRAVKCDAVDALAFSFDGTQILGTTINSSPPSTVVITAPYYDPGALIMDESRGAMWTTSILFPNSSRDCSHAVLMQEGNHEEATWAFAYDRSFEAFRAVRIDDLRNGTTYFTGPEPKSQAKLLPTTLPAANFSGDLVSAGFQGNEIWLYSVPEDLTAIPEVAAAASPFGSESGSSSSGVARRNSSQSSASRPPSTRAHDAAVAASSSGRVAQWQMLCDKSRNNLVTGHKITEFMGVSNVKWVSEFGESCLKERLIVTARGISAPRLVTEEEDMDFVDGGRITLIDFDYAITDGEKKEITIEVGTDAAEVLEEEKRDIETEVAIVRRRTVAQRRGGGSRALLRAATHSQNLTVPQHDHDHGQDDDDPLTPRTMRRSSTSHQLTDGPEDADVASIEEQEAMDAPYAHSSPRSVTTLRRAATAAATNRRLNPRTADGRPVEYRRADGRREHPHESDADQWVPPPPPYQKEDPGDAPAFLRGTAVMAPMTQPDMAVPPSIQTVQHHGPPADIQQTENLSSNSLSKSSSVELDVAFQQYPHIAHTRAMSNSSLADSRTDESRAHSDPSTPADNINIYGVSPPGTPRPSERPVGDAHSPLEMPVSAASETAPIPGFSVTSPSISSVSILSTESPTTERQLESFTVDLPTTFGPGLQASSTFPLDLERTDDAVLPQRRLSASRTWPRAPQIENSEGSSVSMPVTASTTALPPAPSYDQLERLNRRVNQGNPHRLSGGLIAQQAPPRPLAQPYRHSTIANFGGPPPLQRVSSESTSHSVSGEVDQPLIISTPRGVTGAFDPPGRRTSRRSEMPILAPVPQRPRPAGAGLNSRPTVERLETIFNGKPLPDLPPVPAAAKSGNQLIPKWLRGPNKSPKRSASVVNRRPSRAKKGATKNMMDAKKQGWKRRQSKRGRKSNSNSSSSNNKKPVSTGAASSTGWTDISTPSAVKETEKEKKCVVM